MKNINVINLDEIMWIKGKKSTTSLIMPDLKAILIRRVMPTAVVAAVFWAAWYLFRGGLPQVLVILCTSVGAISLSALSFLHSKVSNLIGLLLGSLSGAAIAIYGYPEIQAILWIIMCFGSIFAFIIIYALRMEMMMSRMSPGDVLSFSLSYSGFWSSMTNSCILVFGILYALGYSAHIEIRSIFPSLPAFGLLSAAVNALMKIVSERNKSLARHQDLPKKISL